MYDIKIIPEEMNNYFGRKLDVIGTSNAKKNKIRGNSRMRRGSMRSYRAGFKNHEGKRRLETQNWISNDSGSERMDLG